jgi:rubrerythrin
MNFLWPRRQGAIIIKKPTFERRGTMAVFNCEKCGSQVDTRCKPKKCPQCGETGVMCKVEAPADPKKKK